MPWLAMLTVPAVLRLTFGCGAEDEHAVTFIEELQRRLGHQAGPDAKGGGRMASSHSNPNLAQARNTQACSTS